MYVYKCMWMSSSKGCRAAATHWAIPQRHMWTLYISIVYLNMYIRAMCTHMYKYSTYDMWRRRQQNWHHSCRVARACRCPQTGWCRWCPRPLDLELEAPHVDWSLVVPHPHLCVMRHMTSGCGTCIYIYTYTVYIYIYAYTYLSYDKCHETRAMCHPRTVIYLLTQHTCRACLQNATHTWLTHAPTTRWHTNVTRGTPCDTHEQ